MNNLKIFFLGICLIAFFISACDIGGIVETTPESLLAPETILTNESGIEKVLLGAYQRLANSTGNNRGEIGITEYNTDIMLQHSGGENRNAQQFIDFTLGPETGIMQGTLWDPNWEAIRNTNIVLENLDVLQSNEVKNLFEAEARFVRAVAYYKLYRAFGTVPLRTSTEQPTELPRAPEDEMLEFIETELLAVIPNLPFPREERAYGRAQSGAARAYLTKFYLNTKQWEKSADMALDIMDMGFFELFPDYPDLFKVENEINREFIWIDQLKASDELNSNTFITANFPAGFFKAEPDFFAKPNDEGFEWQNNWRRIASQYTVQDDFVESFDPQDERQELILVTYLNQDGETLNLLRNPTRPDDSRPFKYWPDPEGFGQAHGNDLPQIRYADILLSRAEALNEINGPNQESIELINQVRNRAGLENLSLADFNSKNDLRNHLIDERAWEFFAEGLRRFDLIRFGVYIENAQERGKTNAQPFHVLYPIPQAAMDANPLLEQNPGF